MSELLLYSHRVELREVQGGWSVAVATTKKSEAGVLDMRVHRVDGVFPSRDQAEASGYKYTRDGFRPW